MSRQINELHKHIYHDKELIILQRIISNQEKTIKEQSKEIKDQSKEIEELQKETLYWKAQLLCRENNVISKQKIKDKIEKLEKQKLSVPKEMDFSAFYRIKDLKNIEIKVLQELLEGEKTNE